MDRCNCSPRKGFRKEASNSLSISRRRVTNGSHACVSPPDGAAGDCCSTWTWVSSFSMRCLHHVFDLGSRNISFWANGEKTMIHLTAWSEHTQIWTDRAAPGRDCTVHAEKVNAPT